MRAPRVIFVGFMPTPDIDPEVRERLRQLGYGD